MYINRPGVCVCICQFIYFFSEVGSRVVGDLLAWMEEGALQKGWMATTTIGMLITHFCFLFEVFGLIALTPLVLAGCRFEFDDNYACRAVRIFLMMPAPAAVRVCTLIQWKLLWKTVHANHQLLVFSAGRDERLERFVFSHFTYCICV